jgi:hypothetical protein
MKCKRVEVPKSNFNKVCGRACRIQGKSHLYPYANWALLWINTPENRNCPVPFDGNRNPPILNFNRTCETIYRTHGSVHLWPYVYLASIGIDTAENRNCLKNVSGRLKYRTSVCSAVYALTLGHRPRGRPTDLTSI